MDNVVSLMFLALRPPRVSYAHTVNERSDCRAIDNTMTERSLCFMSNVTAGHSYTCCLFIFNFHSFTHAVHLFSFFIHTFSHTFINSFIYSYIHVFTIAFIDQFIRMAGPLYCSDWWGNLSTW